MPNNNKSGLITKSAMRKVSRATLRALRRPDLPASQVPRMHSFAMCGQVVKLTSAMTAYNAGSKTFGIATGKIQLTSLASDGFTLSHSDSSFPDVYVYNTTSSTPASGELVQVKIMQTYMFADVGDC